MTSRETVKAIDELDAIHGKDSESAHIKADAIVLNALPDVVKEAYQRVKARCGKFYYA